jgi:colicin import membrane protein
MARDRIRPPRPRTVIRGRWLALGLAVLVNLAFVGVLVFSVTWKNHPPAPVSAELYAPPAKSAAPPKPEPEPPKAEPPKPEPPKPEPPKAEPPKPEPAKPPPPKAEPKVDKPDPREAEIALKAKAEAERKRREELAKAEAEKKHKDELAKAEAEKKRKDDERRKADAERLKRETDAMREQAEREARTREVQTKAVAEAEAKARAAQEAQARAAAEAKAKQQAEATARAAAEADWIKRIQAKVRGNVILPPDLAGNPEAVFEVVQLPTGEILDAQLRKSSGVRAYDEAVQRAILKSSPLPRPDRPELFQRTLVLRFRPQE